MRKRFLQAGMLCVLAGLIAPLCMAADDFKPEAGFTLIFNGKNLDGWKTKTGESTDGKTEAYNGRFKAAEGNLVIDVKVKGDVILSTAKEFGKDAHLKFDYMPGAGCNNDLFFYGTKFDLKKADVKNLKEGEWNQFEIIVQGGKAEFKNNGESLKTMPTKSDKSGLGIRAEFGPIQFRHLRVKG